MGRVRILPCLRGSRQITPASSFAIDRGWLWVHESGTYVKLTQAGADLFA